MGLATVTGLARKGYFIPYRYAGISARAGEGALAYPALLSLFDQHRRTFVAVLDAIEAHAGTLLAIGGDPPPAPRWDQSWFPTLDACAAYAIVRSRRPRRIVEIGSGHSTRFLARAVADGALDCTITAIDPAPRARLDEGVVGLIRATAQTAPLDVFAALTAEDILFVDSSHVLMPGTDVDFVLNCLWPVLPNGILVHVHDVFLPEDYPPDWHWRGYNEQSAVAALLGAGAADPVFASRHVSRRLAAILEHSIVARLPRAAGALDASLWMIKRGEPVASLSSSGYTGRPRPSDHRPGN
ncbi:MAG: class I SAM-dependent methyltransferase [Alphaproteobacteria bacterium]|nr:class I SAM-dependent methyltransferase [Alphaproteobacteria bacterium]